jgi:hypothetical protein
VARAPATRRSQETATSSPAPRHQPERLGNTGPWPARSGGRIARHGRSSSLTR